MKLNSLFLLAPLATGACLTELPEAANEAQATQEITGNWSYASQYQLDRAVVLKNCTGTRIAWNYAITALHCDPLVGDQVNFYDGGPGFSGRSAEIAHVFKRSGATPDDTDDSSGLLADVAVIRLQAIGDSGTYENYMEGPSAVLAWEYSGDGVTGTKVGAGNHDGQSNGSKKLRQVADTTDDDNDSGGHFITSDDDSNSGDSGGPFYVDNRTSLPPRILGVLKGYGLDPIDGDWNLYTSMPKHLDWILQKMNYRWRGQPAQLEHRYVGSNVDTFTGSVLECQYACDRTQSCEAYNYFAGTDACALVTGVTGITDSVGYRGALQYGARSGTSNDVVGYRRSDGINVMVHKATNGRVHELALVNGEWTAWDITSNGPLAASKLSAYVRGDGTDAVVYRDASNRIIEIAHDATGWTGYDLSQVGGGTPKGDPVAYVRADGSSAVVYRGTNDNIYELRLGTRGWNVTNLTSAAGGNITASSDPHAYARSDGYNSVVFQRNGQIWELYKKSSSAWAVSNVSSLVPSTPPAAAGRPFGYTHKNGTNAIVYRSTGNHIIELWLSSNDGWRWGELSSSAVMGDPTAYVRTDGKESVLVRSAAGFIYEIANAPWATYNLSAAAGLSSTSATNAAVFIRGDGYNSVVYETSGNHVRELYWRPGGPNWAWGDVTNLANETP